MSIILHLVSTADYAALAPGSLYFARDFEREGFIHCTKGAELMLRVANHFYRQATGDFLVLLIDEDRVTAPVKWEPATIGVEQPSNTAMSVLFPHIYGPLNRDAIVGTVAVQRAPDGEFVGYEHALEAL